MIHAKMLDACRRAYWVAFRKYYRLSEHGAHWVAVELQCQRADRWKAVAERVERHIAGDLSRKFPRA